MEIQQPIPPVQPQNTPKRFILFGTVTTAVVIVLIILAIYGTKMYKRSTEPKPAGVGNVSSTDSSVPPAAVVATTQVYKYYPNTLDPYVISVNEHDGEIVTLTAGQLTFSSATDGVVKNAVTQKDVPTISLQRVVPAGSNFYVVGFEQIVKLDHEGHTLKTFPLPRRADSSQPVRVLVNPYDAQYIWLVSGESLWAIDTETGSFADMAAAMGISGVPGNRYIGDLDFSKNFVWVQVGSGGLFSYDVRSHVWKQLPYISQNAQQGIGGVGLFSVTDDYALAVDYEQHVYLYSKANNMWKIFPSSDEVQVREREGNGRLVLSGSYAYYINEKTNNWYFSNPESHILVADLTSSSPAWKELSELKDIVGFVVAHDTHQLFLESERGKLLSIEGSTIGTKQFTLPKISEVGDAIARIGDDVYFNRYRGFGLVNLTTGQKQYFDYPIIERIPPSSEYLVVRRLGAFTYILSGTLPGYAQGLGAVVYRLSHDDPKDMREIDISSGETSLNGEDLSIREVATANGSEPALDVGINDQGQIFFKANQKTNATLVADWDSRKMVSSTQRYSPRSLTELFSDTAAQHPLVLRNGDVTYQVLPDSAQNASLTQLLRVNITKQGSAPESFTIPVTRSQAPDALPNGPAYVRSFQLDPQGTYLWIAVNDELIRVDLHDHTVTTYRDVPYDIESILPGVDSIIINAHGIYVYKYSVLH